MTNAQQLDTADGVQHDAAAHAEHAHPGGAEYVRIAVILGAITAVEVALYYINLPKGLLATALVLLSILKFALVALYFMHLKFDSRMFSVFFAGGIITTIAAFIAVLAMLRPF